MAFGISGDPLAPDAQMLEHRRLQRPIRGDHAIRSPGAGDDSAPKRQVSDTLEPGPPRIRSAKLFESLWIEDQWRG